MSPKGILLESKTMLEKSERQYPKVYCCLWKGVRPFFQYSLSKIDMQDNEEPLFCLWGDSSKVVLTSHRLHLFKSGVYYPFDLKDVNIKSCISGIIVSSGEYKSLKQVVLPIELFKTYNTAFWTNLLSKMAQAAKSVSDFTREDSSVQSFLMTIPSNSTYGKISKPDILSNEKLSTKDNIENAHSQLNNIINALMTNPSNSTNKTQSKFDRVDTNKIKSKPNILSNEKLSTKDNIENAYSQLIEIINDAYSDIAGLKGVNRKFDEIKNNVVSVFNSQVKDAKDQLAKAKNKTVWDNLVIAFFGETNAGKSTIIETFRILFDPNRKKEDGLIVGDGQHDFTKTYCEYKLSISGKPFTLIDVPGIEGKEEDFRDTIKTALQKAHIVFYINGHNKKPDEATAKKIKNYLGDWVKVYSVYNVRGGVSNYDEEEERETLLTEGVKKSESLIKTEFKRILGDVYKGNLTIQGKLAMCAKASFSKKRDDLIKDQQKLLRYFDGSPEKILQFSQFQTIVNLVDDKSANFKKEIIEANKQKLISLASRIADDITNTMVSQKTYVDRLKGNLNVAEREICNNMLNNAQHSISSTVKTMIDSSFGDLKSYAFGCIDRGDSNLKHNVDNYQHKCFYDLKNKITYRVKDSLKKVEQTSNRKLEELDGVNIKPLSFNKYIDFDAEIDFTEAFEELEIDFSDVVNWAGKTAGTAAAGAFIGSVIPGLGTMIGAAIGGIVGGVVHAASGDGGKADARKSVSDAINKAKDKANRDVNKSLASVFENLRRVSKDLKKAIQTEKRNINTLQEAIDDFDNDINRYVSQLKQQRYGRI